MRVRLRPEVKPEAAISEMRQLAGGSAGAVRSGLSENPGRDRGDYVSWATNVEARLDSILDRREAQRFFASSRHRDICSMPPGGQLSTLIYAEIDSIKRDLEDAAEYLEGHLRRMHSAPGVPIVVDTNVLLQCQRLDSLNWRDQIHAEARVIVPLRVIEEIDTKKYGESKRLRSVARELLPWIDGLFVDGAVEPVQFRPDATIELLLADRPRYRPTDADEEILDVAHDVKTFAGSVKVMTGDTGMRVRAVTEGLEVLAIPEKWRRLDGNADGSEPGAPDHL